MNVSPPSVTTVFKPPPDPPEFADPPDPPDPPDSPEPPDPPEPPEPLEDPDPPDPPEAPDPPEPPESLEDPDPGLGLGVTVTLPITTELGPITTVNPPTFAVVGGISITEPPPPPDPTMLGEPPSPPILITVGVVPAGAPPVGEGGGPIGGQENEVDVLVSAGTDCFCVFPPPGKGGFVCVVNCVTGFLDVITAVVITGDVDITLALVDSGSDESETGADDSKGIMTDHVSPAPTTVVLLLSGRGGNGGNLVLDSKGSIGVDNEFVLLGYGIQVTGGVHSGVVVYVFVWFG